MFARFRTVKLLFFLFPTPFIKDEYKPTVKGREIKLHHQERRLFKKPVSVKTTIEINKDFVTPSFVFLTEICSIKQIPSYGSWQLTKAEAKKKKKAS